MKTMIRAAAVAALALAAGGCVSASKYQRLETQHKDERARSEVLDQQLAAAKKEKDDLAARLQVSGDQLASAQKSNKDLQDSLEANKGELSKKVSELIKDRDALAAEGNALKAKLAEAEAARKALEDARAAELAEAKKNIESLKAGLEAEIAAGEIKLSDLKGRLTVNMVDRILFDSGEAQVKPEGRKILEKVGKVLNQVRDKDIRIEGHTDNVPIKGGLKNRFATNWELSTARATSVARYLEDSAGVDPKRLVAAGLGEFRPVADNTSDEGRARNRRIEIILAPAEKP